MVTREYEMIADSMLPSLGEIVRFEIEFAEGWYRISGRSQDLDGNKMRYSGVRVRELE